MMINQWILRLPTHHSKGWIRLKTWNQLDEIVWQVRWVISLWRYDPVNLEVNPGKPQGKWPLRWQLVLGWFQPLCSRIQHKMLGKYAVCRKTQCEHCEHKESIPHDLGGYFSMDWFRKITSETPQSSWEHGKKNSTSNRFSLKSTHGMLQNSRFQKHLFIPQGHSSRPASAQVCDLLWRCIIWCAEMATQRREDRVDV